MRIIRKKEELTEQISVFRKENNQTIGFVPTMGFLHKGHGSLIERSIRENGLTICDIFVNPLQFNDKNDYTNYPIDRERDIKYLTSLGCNILYLPSHDEIYPPGYCAKIYDFGGLEDEMEGKYRTSHFQGVAEVVRILFEIVKPDNAYFGEKDYQQLKIIEALVQQLGFSLKVISCPVVRETDGLAMSSRNALLTVKERESAPFIYNQLQYCQKNYIYYTPLQLKKNISKAFREKELFKLEYIEFANRQNLQLIKTWEEAESVGAFISAYLGRIRLIDNIKLF